MQQIANATCLFLIKPWKLSSVLLFGYCFRLRCRAKNELKFSKIRFLAEGNFQYGRNVEFTLSTYFILLQFFFSVGSVPFLDFVYLMKLVECF